MEFAREWTAFGGASLSLMGAALFAGARRHAADVRSWRRQHGEALGASSAPVDPEHRFVAGYRAVGAVVALLGAALAAAALAGRSATAAAPGAGPRVTGAAVAALGVAFAVRKATATERGPRFLADDPLAAGARAFDARLTDAAAWALCALWIGAGLRWLASAR